MAYGIVGTAGHVDHGKTCLIKALTGMDTDRLQEEKKRGITIELGFAHMTAPDGEVIGFVDVPGHEKFIKNMLAGVGGMDMILLTVAADEGVMPQTVEHFEILNKIGVKRGIIVITKCDLVDEEWLEMVKEDVRRLVVKSEFENFPCLAVSAYTGQNISDLKQMIFDCMTEKEENEENNDCSRLPIDRCFTIDGHGTVVTGTLLDGNLCAGDTVQLFPSDNVARIRSIEVHGENMDKAFAGQRTAINLSGVKKQDVKRGLVAAIPGSLQVVKCLAVKIQMFSYCQREISHNSRVHFHCGTAETVCRVSLIGCDCLAAKESGYAYLYFDNEIALRRGDKFILRFFSPTESIAGGTVLDIMPPKYGRKPQALDYCKAVDCVDWEQIILAYIKNNKERLSYYNSLRLRCGLSENDFAAAVKNLQKENKVILVNQQYIILQDNYKSLKMTISEILADFHKDNPAVSGMAKEELKSRLCLKFQHDDTKAIHFLTEEMLQSGLFKISDSLVSLQNFQVEYSDDFQNIKEALLDFYGRRMFESSPLDEFIAEGEYQDEKLVKQIAENCVADSELKKTGSYIYLRMDYWQEACKRLNEYFAENEHLTLAEFRDLLDVSRKYAIRILETTDREKMTKMVDDYRIKI